MAAKETAKNARKPKAKQSSEACREAERLEQCIAVSWPAEAHHEDRTFIAGEDEAPTLHALALTLNLALALTLACPLPSGHHPTPSLIF